jgi:hypothetical protein
LTAIVEDTQFYNPPSQLPNAEPVVYGKTTQGRKGSDKEQAIVIGQ